jgi:biotin operon repressor
MPKTKSVRERSTKEDVPVTNEADLTATAATSAPEGDTTALPPTAPDTAATRAVWAALAVHPGSATTTLAETAGISRSAATKALAALEEAGLATRTPGAREGSKRLPDLWHQPAAATDEAEVEVAEPAASAADTADTEQASEGPRQEGAELKAAEEGVSNGDAPISEPAAASAVAGGKTRLGSGKLREMVLDHLREHADQEFTPTALGRLLGRSSGAIGNACEKLAGEGVIAQTSPKPRRFRFKAAAN